MYKTSGGNSIGRRREEESLVKQMDHCRLLNVKWHRFCYCPWILGIFGIGSLISQTKVGNGKPQRNQLHPQRMQAAKNSCMNGIEGLGKFSKVFQDLQGIFGPYSERKIMLVSPSLSQFSHPCTANPDTWDWTQLHLKPMGKLLRLWWRQDSSLCETVIFIFNTLQLKLRISRIKLS